MNADPPPKKIVSRKELAGFAASGRLYAVLHACDSPGVLEKSADLPENVGSCLYSNEAEEDFSSFAPYLFSVAADPLDWAGQTAAQEGGGIFVLTGADHDTLPQHLRRFLLALAPNGEEMYFR